MNHEKADKIIHPTHVGQKIYLWYTSAFLAVASVIFCQLLIFDKTLLDEVDGYLQWYAYYSKLQDVVISLFTGQGSSFWHWDLGLGSDFLSNFGHVIFDPFSYIALLFPKQHLDIAYTLMAILKFYTSGMLMLLFLRYHKKTDLLCLIGAIGYSFCAWALFSIIEILFLTQMVIFPLLVLGVDKVEDGHSPVTLIFSAFFSLLNGIYFSYMSALFITIYIIIRYFTASEANKSLQGFIQKILKYISYAMTSMLLASPIIIPALYTLLSCSKESGRDIHLFPSLVNILRFVPAFAGTLDVNNNYSFPGMNILFVLMIPAIFLQWKNKKASCRMFIVCLPFVLIPGLQSITNGFSYAVGRWCYILAFFFAYAAVECLEWEHIYERKYIKLILFLLLGIFGCSFIACLIFRVCNTIEFLIITLNILFAFICCYVLYELNGTKKQRLRMLAITVMADIAVIGIAFFNPMVRNTINAYMTPGTCHQIYSNSNLRAANAIKDSEFYRADTVDYPTNTGTNYPVTHTPVNLGFYWGVSSPTVYLSTIDGNWLQYNQQLGNNCGYFRRICSFSNDNRSRMDFLQGVKYFFGNDSKTADKNFSQYAGYGFSESQVEQGVSILKSPYDVSLGYVYDKAVSESLFMEHTPLEREQILMQCAVLSEDDLKQTKQVQPVDNDELEWEDSVTVPYQISASNGINLSEHGFQVWQKAALTLKIEEKEVPPGELYLIFHNLHKKPLSKDRLWEVAYPTKNRLTRISLLLNDLVGQSYGNFSMIINRDDTEKRFINAEGEAQAIRNVNDYMANLGYVTNYTQDISCYFETLGDYSYDSIELISVPCKKYEQQAKNLASNRLHVTSYSGDYVAGEVNPAQGGLLYLSILNNPGWKIYIDGKKTEQVYQVNTAFTGIEVTAGKHQIELRYQPVGMPYTIILFLIGIVILIGIKLQKGRKK